jgi:hypothetical protein
VGKEAERYHASPFEAEKETVDDKLVITLFFFFFFFFLYCHVGRVEGSFRLLASFLKGLKIPHRHVVP